MEEYYATYKYPKKILSLEIAHKINVTEKQVRKWFENRRNHERSEQFLREFSEDADSPTSESAPPAEPQQEQTKDVIQEPITPALAPSSPIKVEVKSESQEQPLAGPPPPPPPPLQAAGIMEQKPVLVPQSQFMQVKIEPQNDVVGASKPSGSDLLPSQQQTSTMQSVNTVHVRSTHVQEAFVKPEQPEPTLVAPEARANVGGIGASVYGTKIITSSAGTNIGSIGGQSEGVLGSNYRPVAPPLRALISTQLQVERNVPRRNDTAGKIKTSGIASKIAPLLRGNSIVKLENVQPFVDLMHDAEDLIDKKIILNALLYTKSQEILKRFMRSEGPNIFRIWIYDAGKDVSSSEASELLIKTITVLRELPFDFKSLKNSRLGRVIKRLSTEYDMPDVAKKAAALKDHWYRMHVGDDPASDMNTDEARPGGSEERTNTGLYITSSEIHLSGKPRKTVRFRAGLALVSIRTIEARGDIEEEEYDDEHSEISEDMDVGMDSLMYDTSDEYDDPASYTSLRPAFTYSEDEVAELVEGSQWYRPTTIYLEEKADMPVIHSVEDIRQGEREKHVQSAQYPDISLLPSTPAEPDPETALDVGKPVREIPLFEESADLSTVLLKTLTVIAQQLSGRFPIDGGSGGAMENMR
ncbi:hypothetical protein BGW38_009447 [Lunasporangiospora selenospora]|uniref:Homeobox domain-containing protein n=1 Tax=Lunasporangiospora selenospora TaxID=979761 RepID=A0A9P6FX40_9FUNG|nr:hypothetical protein BGW38_009447 [Lunasporangiospora selenospora]